RPPPASRQGHGPDRAATHPPPPPARAGFAHTLPKPPHAASEAPPVPTRSLPRRHPPAAACGAGPAGAPHPPHVTHHAPHRRRPTDRPRDAPAPNPCPSRRRPALRADPPPSGASPPEPCARCSPAAAPPPAPQFFPSAPSDRAPGVRPRRAPAHALLPP